MRRDDVNIDVDWSRPASATWTRFSAQGLPDSWVCYCCLEITVSLILNLQISNIPDVKFIIYLNDVWKLIQKQRRLPVQALRPWLGWPLLYNE
jgi:hypothetical protein